MKTLVILLAVLLASCTQIKVQTELGIVHEIDAHQYYDLLSVGDTVVIQKSDGNRFISIHSIYTGHVPQMVSGKYYHASRNDSVSFFVTFSKAIVVNK